MGWRGDRCWYCGADLPALMAIKELPAEWGQAHEAEFERHMQADCISGIGRDERQEVDRFVAWYQANANRRPLDPVEP